jgi:hypothetical protein
MADRGCAHLNAVTTVKHAKKRECEECVKTGDSWVHLRTCQECGRTLCLRQTRRTDTPPGMRMRAVTQ